MIDEKDKPQPSAVTRRQAEFKARQRAAGLRQVTFWLHADSWNAGFSAGENGEPATSVPGDVVDELSWFGGWVGGKNKRKSFATKDNIK